MTKTLSSTYAGLYTLTGAVDNPATITATGLLDAGLYAASLSSAWIIRNSGSILGAGVTLASGGTVVNAGRISGLEGVVMDASGSVTNQSGASITGTLESGIEGLNTGVIVTVVNAGTIGGGIALFSGSVTNVASASITGGIFLSAGGNVTNKAEGAISGSVNPGVDITGAGAVVNNGTIAGTGTNGFGVYVKVGSVTNAVSALITGSYIGIATGITASGRGTVVNHGSIMGGGTGVALLSGGTVTNAASASITGGGRGVFIGGGTGTVVNDGGLASTGTNGRGVELAAGGAVTNATAATITGGYDGISVLGGAGKVVNYGSVGGVAGNGVYLNAGGSVTNKASGTITGGGINGDGVGITGSAAGNVVNYGDIATNPSAKAAAVLLRSGGSVTNAASGVITSYLGIDIHGVGAVINDGRVSSTGGTAGAGIRLFSDGSVTNAVSGLITGYLGVHIDGVGTVVNEGTVSATEGTAGAGIRLFLGGSVTNTTAGTITGGANAVHIGGGVGTVINEGSIANDSSHGVILDVGGSVTNAASASITSSYHTVEIAGGTGTVVNDGFIAATGTTSRGVKLQVGGAVTNAISATIVSAGRSAVFIYGNTGTVVNDGSIASTGSSGIGVLLGSGGSVANYGRITGTGANGDGVDLSSGGRVINAASASIIGSSYGVLIHTGAGTLVNYGRIAGTINSSGTTGRGVELDLGGSITNGVSGSIAGIYRGAEITGGAGVVINKGGITSSGTGGNGVEIGFGGGIGTVVNFGSIASTFDAAIKLESGGSVTNTASASIIGGLRGVRVFGDAGTVVNFGRIVGTIAGAGTNGFGVELDSGGNVTNAASASIRGTTFGVYLSAGGTLTNAGTIVGNSGTAVVFGGTGSNLLALDPGFGFSGLVTGSASASNTLELAGTGSGILNELGTTFINFGTVNVDIGTTWTVKALSSALAGVALTGNGTASTLMLTTPGTFSLGGVSKFSTIDLAAGNSTITLTDATLAGGPVTIHDGASGKNIISATGDTGVSKGKSLTYFTSTGPDSFTGGSENDTVRVSAAAAGGDTLTGGSGTNTLTLTSAGVANLGGVSKFAKITLAAGNSTVTVTDATLVGGTVTINDGASGNNTISAAGDTAASTGKTLIYATGTGTDHFTGGFENDTVRVSAAAVGGDTLTGGSGTNTLMLTTPGTFSLGGISKFATINLATGSNTVKVTDKTLVAGAITLKAGASGNDNVSAASDTAASKAKTLNYTTGSGADNFTGGFENDVVRVAAAAVGGDTLTGGSGSNTLILISAGTFSLGGVSKFAAVNLTAGTNTVAVTDKTLTASIALKAGASGNNSISAAGDTAASKTKTLTYSTGSGADSFTGGFENDTIVTTSAALNAGDSIIGGSGINTLMMSGGGVFNLGALKALANIQTLDAAEGQAAGGGIPSGVQTVDLRSGLDQTVNVVSGTPNPLDPNPEIIIIHGTANKAVINLGDGTDTVVIGGAGETVNAGAGTALVSATAAFADALVNGDSGTTNLKITTGGTATLNASDSHLTVDLTAATNLTLSKMSFITAIGSTGNDTITALAQGQTLTGDGGKDTLNGFSGFGDVFSDTSAHLNTTTIGKFGGSDLIDLTDLNSSTIHALTYNISTETLTVTDGTHTANIKFIGSYTLNDFQIGGSDGHTGSLIKFV